MWKKALLIIASILAFGTSGYANDVVLTMPNQATVSYDPFTGVPGLQDVSFEITNGADAPVLANLVITPDISADFYFRGPSDTLAFEILSSQGGMQAGQFIIPVTLPGGQHSQQFSLTFKVPAGQYADAGGQDIDLRVSLIDPQTQEPFMPARILNINSLVPSRAQTNFAGTTPGFDNGSSFSAVEFGELVTGKTRKVNFQIRGNSDVTVEVSSENNGKLVHQTNPEAAFILYSVDADGVVSDLSAPLKLNRRPEKSLAGSSYPFTITLGDSPKERLSGQYKDLITIDVFPN